MFIAILTLLSALSISGVAIFYSVIGLATIFPGAFWPVVIMGSVLEVGKLVTASWLYRNWKHTRFLLKTYLTIAVVILSLITSMGIFGFLSKAHLEQNLAEDTITQRIDIINSKIESQETYIKRQQLVIDRAEKQLSRTTVSNTDAIDIEKGSLKDVQDKFKTLLAVETNAIKELNDRMKILDKDVSDVLKSNKSFFNEEKAAAELKASQKEERALINQKISEAQDRIAVLKQDYAKDTEVITLRIDKLREGSIDDKSDVANQITQAESNILEAQNTIDGLIIDREPLEAKMIKLEAEVGPVKYIAALVVDWGVTTEVDTSEAVRWVILIIIFVFDPLAVLLLVAANQSLLRRFPVTPPKPQEVIDLEKPDEEDVALKWKETMEKTSAHNKMDKATQQLKDWQEKLNAFNDKLEKPEAKPLEIVQEDSNDSDWGDGIIVPEKKTEKKEIVVDNLIDGFDPAEVEGFEEFNSNYDKPNDDQIEKFKQREQEEKEALEEYARKAREEDKPISEQIEEAMEPERTRPDFTEVVEPEVAVEQPKEEIVPKKVVTGMLGVRTVDKGKVVPPPKLSSPATMTDFERTGMLNKFHQEHGKFEDVSESELKQERDTTNKLQFLEDSGITEQDALDHPPITESRMAFFEDHIDDVLRGNTTAESLPADIRKTVAVLLSDYKNPDIITKGSALKVDSNTDKNIETMTAEQLKEKFMAQPQIEDRPITDEELDNLLEGWEGDQKPTGKTRMIIKNGKRIFVPVEEKQDYVQNEEQDDTTMWQKTKELDIPEPEKNEIDLPELQNTIEEKDIPEIADGINVEQSIPKEKFTNYKKRITTDEDYRSRVEARINDLITKVESGEIKLDDLTEEDKNIIIGILNQNG